jgi:hypothetical protein
MVTSPDRGFELWFGETEIVADEAPSPFAGDTVTHEIVSTTDHGQPLAHETFTEAEAPA